VSYIGLFSYYNFDNWTYQPSFVSSNHAVVFNGLRIQWFPTNKLKIEPWIINGWQSYNKFNGHRGLGGQILWRPQEWLSWSSTTTETVRIPLAIRPLAPPHRRQHRGQILQPSGIHRHFQRWRSLSRLTRGASTAAESRATVARADRSKRSWAGWLTTDLVG